MKIYQSNLFARALKNLTKSEKEALDTAVKKIALGEDVGEQKKGDLSGIYVYKFKVNVRLYLLAYRLKSDELELIMFGTHENYYRDLKNYINK